MKRPYLFAGFVVVVVLACLAVVFRWRYDSRVVRGQAEMVRTNRFSGSSERMTDQGWVAMRPLAPRRRPAIEPLPPSEAALVVVEASPVLDPDSGVQTIRALVTNRSRWRVSEVEMRLNTLDDPPRVLRLSRDAVLADALSSLGGALSIDPGASANMEAVLEGMPAAGVRLTVMSISGISPGAQESR